MSTLRGQTIASLAADLAAGRTTSRALFEAALESIAGDGTAYTLVAAARARVEADASDALRKAGIVASPLAGVPVSVKDLFDVNGEATTAGSVLLREAAPASRDATAVARLRAAGAVIIGRTHMSEFAFTGLGANPHHPRCANPHDPARVPGGSSSGAAVSVARGQAAMGLGTDTGGSVRIPAAFTGLVGFKPTQARVTRDGAFPLSQSLDSIGPIANSVACCAFVDALIADAPLEAHSPLGVAGLRLAVPTDLVFDEADEIVARAFERAMGRLSEAGARIERMRVSAFSRMAEITAKGAIANAEAFAHHSREGLLEQRGYDPIVLSRIEIGGRMSARDYLDLLQARADVIAEISRLLAGYDAMALPTCPCVAPRFDDVAESAAFARANGLALRNPALVNFFDGCALSLPMHAVDELPSGLMLAAPRMNDARLLAIGAAVESVVR